MSPASKTPAAPDLTGLTRFTFGDSADLCARLLALVREGRKTATCAALRDFTQGGETLPQVGRHDVALHWDGPPP